MDTATPAKRWHWCGGEMTNRESQINEMKQWIDSATYAQLLDRWRFAPAGDPWFQGEIGDYYVRVMGERRKAVGDAEHSATSKRIGWES